MRNKFIFAIIISFLFCSVRVISDESSEIPVNKDVTYLRVGKYKYKIQNSQNYYDSDEKKFKKHTFELESILDIGYQKQYKADYEWKTNTRFTDKSRFSYKDSWFTFTLDSSNDIVGIIDGGTTIFENAYESTDVIRNLTDSGIEDMFILKDNSAPSDFYYNINYSEIPVVNSDSTQVIIGNVAFSRSVFYDPSGNGGLAKYTLAGNKLRISLKGLDTLDYPIILDPEYYIVAGVDSVYDTYINGQSLGTNYSKETELILYMKTAAHLGVRVLIQFPFSGIVGDSLVSYACSLKTSFTSWSGNKANCAIGFKPLTKEWTSTQTTYDEAKTGDAWTARGGLSDISIADTAYIPVNSINEGWSVITEDTLGGEKLRVTLQKMLPYNGNLTNYGFLLTIDSVKSKYDSSALERYITIYSRESGAANVPRLYLNVSYFPPVYAVDSIAFGAVTDTTITIDSIAINGNDTISLFGVNYTSGGTWLNPITGLFDTILIRFNPAQWDDVVFYGFEKNSWHRFTVYSFSWDSVGDSTKAKNDSISLGTVPSLLSIDTLFFIMYDTTNKRMKYINPDSLFKSDVISIDTLFFIMYDTTNHIRKYVDPDSMFSFDLYMESISFNKLFANLWLRKKEYFKQF